MTRAALNADRLEFLAAVNHLLDAAEKARVLRDHLFRELENSTPEKRVETVDTGGGTSCS